MNYNKNDTAMKRKYITPAIGNMCMDISSLLMASVNSISDTEAQESVSGNTVNLGRQGSFWDETE